MYAMRRAASVGYQTLGQEKKRQGHDQSSNQSSAESNEQGDLRQVGWLKSNGQSVLLTVTR